ncbi:hypothetical protein SAMN05216419_105412 [Nitrosomonas cryotolerans]|uniref:Low-complexity protein n=1 Tax=Nitrosomonas cryotolerans ATCC 49181 TaxID=1131553 RepID=A0A1N6HEU0_9PROT|nr:hypothetical protein [Nitrosomonas cryotolerans]SFQ06692.1 hypothetical protein SAMN05216419_105412 [Nitrosomonas cryotolerans]SIO18358.1 hypothetical protein SAMN02743940_1153 [Nitrosomonas cryotolerans ATCC 49181]
MSKKSVKPISLAVGTAFITSLTVGHLSASTDTDVNPFAMNELSSGYMQLASSGEHGDKKSEKEGASDSKKSEKEGKCGEGKCGGKMKSDKESNADGNKQPEKEGK